LLHRTVRQLRDRGVTDIWITSHDPAYDIPGATRYEPVDNTFQIDQFYACRALWRHLTDVVFLYADVYFSDEALDLILNHVVKDYAYYQRTRGSRITGKPWKEGFALRVWDPEILFSACCHLRGELVAGRLEEQHHQLQGYLEGCGEREYFETVIGPHGVEIDDETDDFDVPSDVQTWTNRVATWRHTATRLRGETVMRPMKPKIKFTDFWAGFNPEDNALHAVLEKHFQAVLCDEPDYLFFFRLRWVEAQRLRPPLRQVCQDLVDGGERSSQLQLLRTTLCRSIIPATRGTSGGRSMRTTTAPF